MCILTLELLKVAHEVLTGDEFGKTSDLLDTGEKKYADIVLMVLTFLKEFFFLTNYHISSSSSTLPHGGWR